MPQIPVPATLVCTFHFRYLHDLCSSSDAFFSMLRHYIHGLYHGSLVHSTEFLSLYFKTFPELRSSQEEVCHRWLNDDGMCKEMRDKFHPDNLASSNPLYAQFLEELGKWRAFDAGKTVQSFENGLTTEQLVLILEKLCGGKKLKSKTLKRLGTEYSLSKKSTNPDVLHRWCEIIVKHGLLEHLGMVEWFLEEHQAMGIYLYGEMVLSRKKKFRAAAKKILESLESEMDTDLAKSAREMVFGD